MGANLGMAMKLENKMHQTEVLNAFSQIKFPNSCYKTSVCFGLFCFGNHTQQYSVITTCSVLESCFRQCSGDHAVIDPVLFACRACVQPWICLSSPKNLVLNLGFIKSLGRYYMFYNTSQRSSWSRSLFHNKISSFYMHIDIYICLHTYNCRYICLCLDMHKMWIYIMYVHISIHIM